MGEGYVLALPVNGHVKLRKFPRFEREVYYVQGLPANEQVKIRSCAKYEELNKDLGSVASEAEFVGSPSKEDSRKASNIDTDLEDSRKASNVDTDLEDSRNASNVDTDDICVRDSEPIVVQDDNLNGFSMENSSENNTEDDLFVCGIDDDQVNSGEITSDSSAQSCTESGFCTNYVTGYSPDEHSDNTGSPKIRLRIRKRSEECSSNNQSNSSAQVLSNDLHDGICTDGEQRAAKRRALPTKGAGKSLSLRSSSLVTGMKKKGRSTDLKKRNDSLHKLLFLPDGLPDGTYLAYKVRGQTVLEGYKKENGIFCNHCSTVVSPSQFEAHAGMAGRKKPYQHIFTADGIALHDIAITLAEGQKHQTSSMDIDENDIRLTSSDCVDASSRPRKTTISMRRAYNKKSEIDENDMRLTSSDCVDASSRPRKTTVTLRRAYNKKKSETDSGGSCVLCSGSDFSVNKFDDRTVIICDQCEKEFHVGCLREDGRCDLKGLPTEKWFCCCDCDRIFSSLRNLVSRKAEVIPSSESSEINKKLKEEGLREVGDNDIRLRLLKGRSCPPEYRPLLSKAVCLFRESFGSITAASGRDLIPPMVNGRNYYGQEFGGMYCAVLTVKSVVVSVALVRVLGREVAEVPLVATRMKYRGKGLFHALFSEIEKVIGFLKVEKLVLPATETAKDMWMDKFGFTEISQEKLSSYTKVLPVTVFEGTVMLEKQVQQES